MRREFGDASRFVSVTVNIDSIVSSHMLSRTSQVIRGRVTIREAIGANGTIIGFGITDDVRGKEQPITYITLIKPDGTIADIEVLAYRESYGGEVQYESFRKQFRGKRASSDIRLGRDIQNIAGATISSRAITVGARKVIVLFDELRKDGKL